MIDLITGAMERAGQETFSQEEIRHFLAEYHSIERIEMEIAQPNRIPEVLSEMERRDLVEMQRPDEWALLER